MRWGCVNVSQRRLEFVVRGSSGKEQIKALCEEFAISRPTGYLWLSRFRAGGGLQELAEKSRRPHRSPKQTPLATEARLIALRRQYPDWGAKKLVKLLAREEIHLPRITAHRILLRQGLIGDAERHRPAVKRFARELPNQLWQMDFKGMPASRPGCLPLVILDDHSRYLLGLFDVPGTQAQAVRRCLETVFARDGVPEAMLMDHGTPWWTMTSDAGWTWLTVWLMKQDIRIYLSGYRHPQTQGKTERCNGSLEAAMRKRPKPPEQSWQIWLDAYRHEHNHVRPHEALNMDIPAQHWSPSVRRFPATALPYDYPDPANVYRIQPHGGIYLGGRQYFISRALIGEDVQLERFDDRAVVYFYRTPVRELHLATATSHPLDFGQFARSRTRGLSREADGGFAPATPHHQDKTSPEKETL